MPLNLHSTENANKLTSTIDNTEEYFVTSNTPIEIATIDLSPDELPATTDNTGQSTTTNDNTR